MITALIILGLVFGAVALVVLALSLIWDFIEFLLGGC